jgi:flavin-binding protein dodecin
MGRREDVEKGSYKKILIATDGSESSTHAINAGMEIARLSEGETMQNVSFLEAYLKK